MHNIVGTSYVRLDLGGNYAVEIFNIQVSPESQAAGTSLNAVRAYAVDNGGRMDPVSLDIAVGMHTIDSIRVIAQNAIRHNQGLNRVLDAINFKDEK